MQFNSNKDNNLTSLIISTVIYTQSGCIGCIPHWSTLTLYLNGSLCTHVVFSSSHCTFPIDLHNLHVFEYLLSMFNSSTDILFATMGQIENDGDQIFRLPSVLLRFASLLIQLILQ